MKQHHAPAIEEATGTAIESPATIESSIKPSQLFAAYLDKALSNPDLAASRRQTYAAWKEAMAATGIDDDGKVANPFGIDLRAIDNRKDFPVKGTENAMIQACKAHVVARLAKYVASGQVKRDHDDSKPIVKACIAAIVDSLSPMRAAANKAVKVSANGSIVGDRTALVVAGLANGKLADSIAETVGNTCLALQGATSDEVRFAGNKPGSELVAAWLGVTTTSAAATDATAAAIGGKAE